VVCSMDFFSRLNQAIEDFKLDQFRNDSSQRPTVLSASPQ
jgi:hypothetical protein